MTLLHCHSCIAAAESRPPAANMLGPPACPADSKWKGATNAWSVRVGLGTGAAALQPSPVVPAVRA